MYLCSSSRSTSTSSIPTSGDPCTSFAALCVVSEVVGAVWALDVAWVDVLGVVLRKGPADVDDVVTLEQRGTGRVNEGWELAWGVLRRSGSECRRF